MKIFDRQFESKYQPRRINEDLWFREFQPLLLKIVNTKEGRDLLCVPREYPRIARILKNQVTFIREQRKDKILLTTDFRIGSKWGNVIRSRWFEFLELCQQLESRKLFDFRNLLFPMIPVYGRAYDTLTAYPDPDPETTTVDGHARHTYTIGTNSSWATIIAAAGSAASDTETVGPYIQMQADNGTDGWLALRRWIALFDTSSIADGNNIDSATLSLFGSAKTDTLSVTPDINIYSSAPASNTAVAAGDFDSLGSTAFSTVIAYANWNTAAYNDFVLNANGRANISKTGVSKFGARNANYDAAAVAPAWSASNPASNLNGQSSSAGGDGDDPKLVVNSSIIGQFLSTNTKYW